MSQHWRGEILHSDGMKVLDKSTSHTSVSLKMCTSPNISTALKAQRLHFYISDILWVLELSQKIKLQYMQAKNKVEHRQPDQSNYQIIQNL